MFIILRFVFYEKKKKNGARKFFDESKVTPIPVIRSNTGKRFLDGNNEASSSSADNKCPRSEAVFIKALYKPNFNTALCNALRKKITSTIDKSKDLNKRKILLNELKEESLQKTKLPRVLLQEAADLSHCRLSYFK